MLSVLFGMVITGCIVLLFVSIVVQCFSEWRLYLKFAALLTGSWLLLIADIALIVWLLKT